MKILFFVGLLTKMLGILLLCWTMAVEPQIALSWPYVVLGFILFNGGISMVIVSFTCLALERVNELHAKISATYLQK